MAQEARKDQKKSNIIKINIEINKNHANNRENLQSSKAIFRKDQ